MKKRNGNSGVCGMETQDHKTRSPDARTAGMLAELHELERRLTGPSIAEAIRLLESDKFPQLTSTQIRSIAEYQPIAIEDERFFEKAFSRGKEVAASLAYANYIGREVVLEDLLQLRATVSGPAEGSTRDPERWRALPESRVGLPAAASGDRSEDARP